MIIYRYIDIHIYKYINIIPPSPPPIIYHKKQSVKSGLNCQKDYIFSGRIKKTSRIVYKLLILFL